MPSNKPAEQNPSFAKFQGQAPGIDGVTTIPELVQRLRPHFASSSLFQAPGATAGATGNRTVANTTANTSTAQNTPGDSARLALAAGTVTWTFTTKFNKPPAIAIAVEGAPAAGVSVYIGVASNAAVIITSTSNTDTRFVNLIARGNPN